MTRSPTGRLAALAARFERGALADAWQAMWTSRLVVVALVVYTWLRLSPAQQLVRGAATTTFGPRVAHAFDGWALQGLWRTFFEPLAVWDSVGYISIASGGYASSPDAHTAFFPVYPLLVRAVSLFSGSVGATIVAAYAVSLVALFAALYLLHRLTELELGRAAARPTILLVAFFPAAFILGAPYTESVFLLVSVAAVYAARRGRWAWAGALVALASATRNSGILLALPVAVLYLYGPRGDRAQPPGPRQGLRPRHPLRRDAAWLLLAPAGLAAYMIYLSGNFGDALAWAHGQTAFDRVSAAPWTGLWDGVKAAWNALHGREPRQFSDFGSLNVLNLAVFLAACGALVGTFRRLPAAYGLYVLPALILPLTAPRPDQPLEAMTRYVLALFPLFMWLGAVCAERRRTELVVGGFAALMGVLTVQFATGRFVF